MTLILASGFDIFGATTLSVATLSITIDVQHRNVVILVMLRRYAVCHYAERRNTECHYNEYCYVEYRNTGCLSSYW
jgi:hypothetical protein